MPDLIINAIVSAAFGFACVKVYLWWKTRRSTAEDSARLRRYAETHWSKPTVDQRLLTQALEPIMDNARRHAAMVARWDAQAKFNSAEKAPPICFYCDQAILPTALCTIERTDVVSGKVVLYPAHEACDIDHYEAGPDAEDFHVH